MNIENPANKSAQSAFPQSENSDEQKKFIERVGKMAVADMKESKILASLKIAQAILESGWGRSTLTAIANNLYGIKVSTSWKGRFFSLQTQEFFDGSNKPTTVTALFRAYDSWEESVADHSALLTGLPRYRAVVGETCYKKACRAVHAAGYATDPKYADKLIQLIELYSLYVYDSFNGSDVKNVELSYPGITNNENSFINFSLADAEYSPMKIRRNGNLFTAHSFLLKDFNFVLFRDMADILDLHFLYHDEAKEVEIFG